MFSLTNIFITGFIIALLVWLFHIHESIQWLRQERAQNTSDATPIDTYLLIPVLDESPVIASTVSYFNSHFLSDQVKLFLITTEKEDNYVPHRQKKFKQEIKKIKDSKQLASYMKETFCCRIDKTQSDNLIKSALNLIDKYANTVNLAARLSQEYENVEHIHYPEENDKMAHQLNYALGKLDSQYNMNPEALVGVYNADSRPEPESLDWIHGKYDDTNVRVFQQYGSYVNSERKEGDSYFDNLISSAARWWQTRWSIGFEINHALHQFDRKNKILYPMNYCIGHGLFMSMKVLRGLGGFAEETYNEDAILGLQMSYNQEKIMPVPYFDRSDAPSSVRSLFQQQMNWYMGPLQSFLYFELLKDKSKKDKSFLFLLSLKLFMHGIYWIVGPACMLLMLLIPVIQDKLILLVFSFALAYIYLILPVVRVKNALTEFFKDNPDLRSGVIGFIGMLGFYLLHGVAGWSSIGRYVYSKLNNAEIAKGTTNMD